MVVPRPNRDTAPSASSGEPPGPVPGAAPPTGDTAPAAAEPPAAAQPPQASEPPAATQPPAAARPPTEQDGPTTTELASRLADVEDQFRRTLADLDNLRKRTAREIQRQRAEERARVAAEWLAVVDNLDLALEHARSDPGAIVAGVHSVRDSAVAILARLGFPRDDHVGEPFDPKRHEAVATVPDPDARESTVIRMVRPGYGSDTEQLRPAAVVVATRGSDAPDT